MQQAIEQRGFAATEEAGEERNGGDGGSRHEQLSRTTGTTTAHHEINFRRPKSLGQRDINLRYRFVETKRLPARLAREVRVMTVRKRFGFS